MVAAAKNKDTVVIKKYANRRLYNTDSSSYVTLEDLCEMVKDNREFVVYDAKTGEDITHQILTQIIFEQEAKGKNLLPINFLRTIISYYDNSMREILPHYLEASMDSFMKNQEEMRKYVGNIRSVGGEVSPLSQLEEIGKQNMQLFQRAFQMFTPFDNYFGGRNEEAKSSEDKKPSSKKRAGSRN